MKFTDFPYERPDMAAIQSEFNTHLEAFKQASDFTALETAMTAINALRFNFESMESLCSIRHTVDTTDAFYEAETDFFDENTPLAEGMVAQFYEALLSAPYQAEIEGKWGKQLLAIAACQIRTFDPIIIDDLQTENKLVSQYTKLIASAKIPFQGEERTLAQLTPFTKDLDRSVRASAMTALSDFFETHEKTLDDLYDQLVKTRTTIAKKLGYDTYVPLAYDRLMRTDYDAKQVENFRNQVHQVLVPMATTLRKAQKERLGVETLTYYDEPLEFLSGNAKPHGDPEWILNHGVAMYHDLSPETKTFIDFMMDHGLMDLVSKKGKAGGGYCTYLANHRAPFIFSNFNGTSHDVDVLTHEAGHAFQVFSSRDFDVPEYTWPTYEACEVHSMSMEFFTWPYMERFFEEEAMKYRYSHLAGALMFIPYGVSVDEFQHFVYEHPDVSPDERKTAWRRIEEKYLPHRDYENNTFFNKGTFWYKQGHIFNTPFYYIDYTLAQVCAFQFFKWIQEDPKKAWERYNALCKKGGSQGFVNLITSVGLQSPFESGTVQSVVTAIEAWLTEFQKEHTLV